MEKFTCNINLFIVHALGWVDGWISQNSGLENNFWGLFAFNEFPTLIVSQVGYEDGGNQGFG